MGHLENHPLLEADTTIFEMICECIEVRSFSMLRSKPGFCWRLAQLFSHRCHLLSRSPPLPSFRSSPLLSLPPKLQATRKGNVYHGAFYSEWGLVRNLANMSVSDSNKSLLKKTKSVECACRGFRVSTLQQTRDGQERKEKWRGGGEKEEGGRKWA